MDAHSEKEHAAPNVQARVRLSPTVRLRRPRHRRTGRRTAAPWQCRRQHRRRPQAGAGPSAGPVAAASRVSRRERKCGAAPTPVAVDRSAAEFASYCGVAPIEVSSGDVQRHRLSRAGDRQLNYALHVIPRPAALDSVGRGLRMRRQLTKRPARPRNWHVSSRRWRGGRQGDPLHRNLFRSNQRCQCSDDRRTLPHTGCGGDWAG